MDFAGMSYPTELAERQPKGHLLISRFHDLLIELGRFNALYWSFNRLFDGLRVPCRIYRYLFMAQPVATAPFLPSRLGQAIDIRILQPTDDALADLPIEGSVLRYRFAQNAVCFGAFQDNAIVGCLWLCLASYKEDEVRCRYKLSPENATAWDFDVYVAPAARGGFAFLKLWDAANAYLHAQGVTWSLSRISAFNPESLRAHQKLGARRFASAVFVQLGRLQLMVSPVRPCVHLSVSSSQTPTLALSADAIDPPE
jgi:hypothetical protein